MDDEGASAGDRARFAHDLRPVFLDARRLATQLRDHAELVPYARHGVLLRDLAARAQEQAAVLARELRTIAGNADPSDPTAPRTGRNHWERLTGDLADLESLKGRYVELALRWDVVFPGIASELHALGRNAAEMSRAVRDMLALSDPHAA